MNIKDIIRDNKVHFYFYRHNIAYYKVYYEGDEYYFPVPLENIEGASLFHTEKAISYIGYIRKALEDKTFVKIYKEPTKIVEYESGQDFKLKIPVWGFEAGTIWTAITGGNSDQTDFHFLGYWDGKFTHCRNFNWSWIDPIN